VTKPSNGKVGPSASKGRPRTHPLGAGRNHVLGTYELRGKTVLGPASIWTSIHRMGETFWLKSCRRNCRRSMTGDHGRCGAGYANGAHDAATSNNSDNWNEGLPLSDASLLSGWYFFWRSLYPFLFSLG
jgi:hypothetical protein